RHVQQYTTNDLVLAETVAGLATRVFPGTINPRISRERDWYQVYLSATGRLTHRVRNPIAKWLDELGVFGLRSYEKFVPEKVFRQPRPQIARFLRHLWSTDGCIILSVGGDHYANIYYASSSARLARDVQSLLLRLEINARMTRHSQGRKGRDQYHIELTGKADIERFVATVVGSDELMSIASSDVYWDRVASIEPDGEHDVYDLTVDNLHNFIAGNIVLHNSIEQDSDVVLFIYRERFYNDNVAEDRRNIA